MVKQIDSKLNAQGLRVGIVVARFNSLITEALLKGAVENLVRHGASENDITVAWVPGSFEIPLLCKKLAESKAFDAVIALGAVIRGATAHYDAVVSGVTSGVAQVSLQTSVPVIFGVLTTDSIEQAIERAGTKGGNKGADAALAAIEMVSVLRQVGTLAR